MNKGYIICVDDEMSVLETLKQQLQTYFGETNEIELATSAEEAIELIHTLQGAGEIVELIITDQVMPGMKGDEFLESIHKISPDAMKILLTGQAGLDSAIHAINRGGLNRYIEKPWDIKTLSNDIKELLNKFHQNLETQHLLNELNNKIKALEAEK